MKISNVLLIFALAFFTFQCGDGATTNENADQGETSSSVSQNSNLTLDSFRNEYTRIHNFITTDYEGWVAKINASAFDQKKKEELIETSQEIADNITIESFAKNSGHSASTMRAFIDDFIAQIQVLSR